MTSRFGIAALAAAVFAAGACKPESARRADRAAKEAIEKRKDLIKAAEKLGDAPDLVHGTKSLLREAGELATATHEFEHRKSARIAAARGHYEVIASQPKLIGTLASNLPLTDAARGALNEKLAKLQMRLDEASNLIDGLATVGVDTWEARDTEMTDALQRLDDARRDAWRTLEKAPHSDPSSS